MNKSFKTLTTAAIISVTLAAAPVMANENAQREQAMKNEEIGFGAGMVIGAIVAGPVGAFITGIAGNFIAKHINVIDERDNLELALTEQQTMTTQEIAQYQQKLEQSEMAYEQQLYAMEQNYKQSAQLQAENLMMSLQFSTGSSEIKPHYREQISALANMLKQTPSLNLDLSGYTDLQGNDEINEKLSMARVISVKEALVQKGVDAERISVTAFGANAPVVANAQNKVSFYDRRVVIKLRQDESTMARN